MGESSVCVDFVSPHPGARLILYDVAMGVPAFAFLAFLAWHLKPSLRKLRRSQSQIMTTYYSFLWAIGLLTVLRCIVQIAETGTGQPVLWNLLWLGTRFGMVLLEVSVVVFLLQGYMTTGREALMRTLVISASAAGTDTLVKVIYIFALHIPLFLFGGTADSAASDMRWSKWSYWLLHNAVFALVYGAILVLSMTRWRDVLPAKRSFYHYVRCLLAVYVVMALGAILIGSGVLGGYCVYGLALWLYYAAYPPLLYVTFLMSFFADEQLDLDLMYYSEMHDAGCFDEDGLTSGY